MEVLDGYVWMVAQTKDCQRLWVRKAVKGTRG